MKEKIIHVGIIGIDHKITTLSASIQKVLENTTKNINEIIEEEKSIKFEVPYLELPKESRTERRARERKENKLKQHGKDI